MIRSRIFLKPFVRRILVVQFNWISDKGNLNILPTKDVDLKNLNILPVKEEKIFKNLPENDQENASSSTDTNEENITIKILDASLPFVARYGWTTETISAGAEATNFPGVIHGLFDDPSSALVFHLYRKLNAQLVDHLEKNSKGDAKIGDFISEKLRLRLEMVLPYIDRWPEALGILTKPANVPTAAQLLLKTCDDIWFHAGDRSTDFSWYTKRTSLMAVYAASQLYLLQDKSPNYEETWKFMKRRLVDVRTAGTTITKVQDSISTAGDVGYSMFQTVRNMFGMNSTRRS